MREIAKQVEHRFSLSEQVMESYFRSLSLYSCIFSDDRLFMRRLAYVETRDGTLYDTYSTSYNGGIWKVICYCKLIFYAL